MFVPRTFFVLLLQVASSLVTPTQANPTVRLDGATVTGVTKGTVNEFLGIPYVKPPIGPLRLRVPQPIPSYTKNFAATAYGPVCPQQAQTLVLPDDVPEIVREEMAGIGAPSPLPISEDCLTVNVIAPSGATPRSKFPVLVLLIAAQGGFEIGFPSSTDGSVVVNQSIALGSPVVYVMFGFLASKEVRDAGLGNLGLRDQRQALRWVQRYITQFGGDPSKVTLWGESAGAISTSLQMVTNGGNNEGLFRAAIMDSGTPLWFGDITHGQQYYDHIVNHTGCASSSDTLDCLRNAPFEALMSATNSTPNMFVYQALAEAFIPRVDGVFLTDNPQQLVKRGSVANVPMINGVNDDEGTLFSFTTLNITTNEQLVTYFQTYYVPGASTAEIEHVLALYPTTPLLERSGLQPTWTYLYKRGKATPYLGAFHSTELANAYGGGDLGAFFIRFAATLNPSAADATIKWPKYTLKSPDFLTFLDGDVPLTITQDDYRVEAIRAMTEMMLLHPY
ncbi:carotenoid ester lipase precursor [Mycena leptocephala]|nr:carotenoid ester lipase precursor [Mycena leptocephala]